MFDMAGILGAVTSMISAAAGSLISKLGVGCTNIPDAKPSFEISLDDKAFVFSSEASMLTDVVVDYTVFDSKAGACIITIKNPTMENKETKIRVTKDFKIPVGAKIVLSMGYNGTNAPIFTGFVIKVETSVERSIVETHANQISVLRLTCVDPKWFLMSNKKTDDHSKCKTYSAVVKEVLGDSCYAQKFALGNVDIKGEPQASAFFGKVACQDNETDFDFLKRLAEETGSLFYADEGGILHFTSLNSTKAPKGIIKKLTQEQAMEASFEMGRYDIPTSVMVVGMDPKNMTKTIKNKIKDSTPIGSGKDSDSSTKNTLKTSDYLLRLGFPVTKKYVEFRAKAIMDLKEIHFIKAKVKLKGTPGFQLRQQISIGGIATIPANKYLISGITHEFHAQPSSEFITTLTLSATRSKTVETSKKL